MSHLRSYVFLPLTCVKDAGSRKHRRFGSEDHFATIDLNAEEDSFDATLFCLQDWEEAWDPATWYGRTDAPTFIDQANES